MKAMERVTAAGLAQVAQTVATIAATVALLWHCIDGERPERAAFGEAVVAGGLATATPAVQTVLRQILAGR